MIVDQQPHAHNNGHWYCAMQSFVNGSHHEINSKFKFLHLASAIKYAKAKTIPCIIYNQDGVIMKDFSKIHEF